jgi:hypothetical protein
MWNLLRSVSVTEKIYNRFINTGKVSDSIIRMIAIKLMKDEELNWYELTIFYGKTTEINEMIIKLTKC